MEATMHHNMLQVPPETKFYLQVCRLPPRHKGISGTIERYIHTSSSACDDDGDGL